MGFKLSKQVANLFDYETLFACMHAKLLQSCLTLQPNGLYIGHQAPLSVVFSRQEYPPSGDLPNSGNALTFLKSPALAGRFFTTSATWEALLHV